MDEFVLHDLHTQHEINIVELELTYKILYIYTSTNKHELLLVGLESYPPSLETNIMCL
jgi:hypothetical protein